MYICRERERQRETDREREKNNESQKEGEQERERERDIVYYNNIVHTSQEEISLWTNISDKRNISRQLS